MRNLILTIACLLVPICVAVLDAYGQEKEAALAEAGKTENCARVEQDAKSGVYRVWIELDKSHSTIAKFKTAPTADDIRAVREKVLAQEAEALAQAAADKAKLAEAEALKAAGKCPTCGQTIPVEVTK